MKKIDNFIIQAGSLGRIPAVSMTPAYSGGLLLLPGFEFPVVIDLEPFTSPKRERGEGVHEQNIPILRNHDPNREIGHTEKIIIDGNTVNIDGKLSFDNDDVTEIVQTNKAGKRWQVSVGSGAVPTSMQQFIPEGKNVTINGQVQTGPIIIVRTPIREVSFVPAGADLHNSVTIHASNLKGTGSMKTFEEWVQERGFDLSTIDDANKAALQKIYEAETAEPVEAEAMDIDKDKPDEKSVQASAMRSRRNTSSLGTASVGTTHRVGAAPVIEASLLMSGGISDTEIEKLGYDHRTIDQAVSRENRGMGLHSLFHACIAAAGMHYPGGRADNGLIETAFEASNNLRRRGVQASMSSFSSVNLPGILSNVANKTLMNAYRRIESIAMQISYIATASDFKEISHYQFEMDGTLQVVDEGADIPQRNPIIESGEMDFNKLGMAWRCYFDFGVGLLDPRAGVYSDGSTA